MRTSNKKASSNPLEAVLLFGLDCLEAVVYRVVASVVKPRKRK